METAELLHASSSRELVKSDIGRRWSILRRTRSSPMSRWYEFILKRSPSPRNAPRPQSTLLAGFNSLSLCHKWAKTQHLWAAPVHQSPVKWKHFSTVLYIFVFACWLKESWWYFTQRAILLLRGKVMKICICVWQTFAVSSVKEWHVNDRGLVLLPLKHVAVLWPISLLQDSVVYLWERLLHLSCIVSGKGQSLQKEKKGTLRHSFHHFPSGTLPQIAHPKWDTCWD